MNNEYISRRSSILTPTYLSFVNIDILEYADLHISLVFRVQSPASSDIHTPNTLQAQKKGQEPYCTIPGVHPAAIGHGPQACPEAGAVPGVERQPCHDGCLCSEGGVRR